jgi:hypothetical protein
MSSSSSVEHLDQVLGVLDTICSESGDDTVQPLAQSASSAATKLWCQLNQSRLTHLANLVQSETYAEATRELRKMFPVAGSASRVEAFKQMLALVHKCRGLHLFSAIKWLGYLEAELQQVGLKPLYLQLIHIKGHSDQSTLLMLLQRNTSRVPDGVLDTVRAALDADCDTIVDRMVEGIKKQDTEVFNQINSVEVLKILMPLVLRKFDIGYVIQFILG